MKAPTPRHLRSYVAKCLGLKRYLQRPGDDRRQPRIRASHLGWIDTAVAKSLRLNR